MAVNDVARSTVESIQARVLRLAIKTRAKHLFPLPVLLELPSVAIYVG